MLGPPPPPSPPARPTACMLHACVVQDLDVGRLARALGLLRLPRMPDMRKPKGADTFVPSAIEPETVRYKDKAREKQRQAALKQRAAAGAAAADEKAAKRKAQAQVREGEGG